MRKILPVTRRSTVTAWIAVIVLAAVCITGAFFLERSTVFGSTPEGYGNPFGPPISIPVTVPKEDNNTQERCQDEISSIQNDVDTRAYSPDVNQQVSDTLANYKQYPSTLALQLDIVKSGISDQDSSDYRNLQTHVDNLKDCDSSSSTTDQQQCDNAQALVDGMVIGTNKQYAQGILDNVNDGSLSATDASAQIDAFPFTGESNSGALKTNLKSAITDCATTSGAVEGNTACEKAANYAQTEVYPGSDADIATINSGTSQELKNLSAELETTNDTKLQSFYSTLSSYVAQCATEREIAEGTGDATGGGTTIDTTYQDWLDQYAKWYKWSLLADILNSIISGDWQGALSSLFAYVATKDQFAQQAAYTQAANNNPEAFYGYSSNLANNGYGGYGNSTWQPSSTWYNPSYTQNRALSLSRDLFKVDVAHKILSSVGNIVSKFMGADQADKFLTTWNDVLDNGQDIAQTAITAKYSDLATLAGNYLTGTNSSLGWLLGGYNGYYNGTYNPTTYYDPNTQTYQTGEQLSGDQAQLTYDQIQAQQTTYHIFVRQGLGGLTNQLVTVVGKLFMPTYGQGIFLISRYNQIFQLISADNTGTTLWQNLAQ